MTYPDIISRIEELIIEYADCREELSAKKVAMEVYAIVNEDYRKVNPVPPVLTMPGGGEEDEEVSE